ncbi:hypothetical protein [Burkholderia sp. Ac-20379]|uniref:hypothetical protein n=1 Tax=Burkholderia sp. Ac-20379 TaxID=2703900 RepID=UPI001981775A|nr:hypothetical protein [Burkholderia sp. Ac-20379]MBN3727013.1 hypothetical protein [Burkholderia sp. Ac-20379]
MSVQPPRRGKRRPGTSAAARERAANAPPIVPRWLFTPVLLLWWVGGYGWAIVDIVRDRGPFALLLHWQTALFGGSSLLVAAGLAAVAIFLGPRWAVRGLRRVWPGNALLADLDAQLRDAGRSRGALAARSRAAWRESDAAGRLRIARRARNIGLGMAGIALIAGGGLSAWLHWVEYADAGQPLTPVALVANRPVALGNASDWVRVSGASPQWDAVLVRDYTIRRTSYRDYSTPLVPAGWRKGDRVYLLEEDRTVRRGNDDENDRQANPPGLLEGSLSFGGPRDDVAAAFQRDGYDVGPWTAVLRRDTSLRGRIPGVPEAVTILIWGETAMFVLIGLGVAINRQMRMRRIERQSA